MPFEFILVDFPGMDVLQLSWSQQRWHFSVSFSQSLYLSSSKSLIQPRFNVSSLKLEFYLALILAIKISQHFTYFAWVYSSPVYYMYTFLCIVLWISPDLIIIHNIYHPFDCHKIHNSNIAYFLYCIQTPCKIQHFYHFQIIFFCD